MAHPPSLSHLPLIPEALRIMDRMDAPVATTPEALVRQCYLDQGLPLDEDRLRQAKEETSIASPLIAEIQPMRRAEDIQTSRWDWLPRAAGLAIMASSIAAAVMVFFLIGGLIFKGAHTHKPQSDYTLSLILRGEVAHDTPAEFKEWLKKDPLGAQVMKEGTITVADRENRTEARWSGLSSATCHAFLKSLYDEPPEITQYTIDGATQGIACDGPSHEVLISPKI
jgi:hypothetical protein